MRIVAWNVGPRPAPAIVQSYNGIRATRHSDLTALFEASNRELVFRLRRDHPDHRVLWGRTDVVVLIPRSHPRPRVEVVGHDVAWKGPHMGVVHHGRKWPLLIWDDIAVLPIHRVTPIGNAAAWEADRRVIAHVAARTDLPRRLAIPGDHNGTDARLRAEYAAMGLTLLPMDAKVDQCAARGLHGTGVRLGNHESDHVAVGWPLK